MNRPSPPPFIPHRMVLGGDAQTVFATFQRPPLIPPAVREVVDCGDDQVALFRNDPESESESESESEPVAGHRARGEAGPGNVLLIHGISGCHSAPYMIAIANQLLRSGFRTFRMDNRGCGSLRETATTVTNAARSGDVAAAISHIADHFGGSMHAIGVSLGGNQLLRLAGRVGAGLDSAPTGWNRMRSIATVAPPIDLPLCSANMDRLRNRIYNRYFIRALLRRIPPAVAQLPLVRAAATGPSMVKLRQFDDRITAPLGGYGDASEYYHDASAVRWMDGIEIPTQIITSADDPIVPTRTFSAESVTSHPKIERLITRRGGHVGYVGPRRSGWLAERLADWTAQHAVSH